MTDKSISVKMLKEEDLNLQYLYEGIFTLDFSQAGIFELDKSIFNDIEKKNTISDFSMYAMELFLEKKIKIIKLCQYPILSEDKEDYCVISACAKIISTYFESKKIVKDAFLVSDHDKEILKNNEEFMQILKQNGVNFEYILNNFYSEIIYYL